MHRKQISTREYPTGYFNSPMNAWKRPSTNVTFYRAYIRASYITYGYRWHSTHTVLSTSWCLVLWQIRRRRSTSSKDYFNQRKT